MSIIIVYNKLKNGVRVSGNFPKVLFPKGYVRPSEIPQAAMGADHAAARMC